ncbi:hypothetical protein Val02_22930 [Virgisporangium aliadipatigenens]|uniref:Mycothiol-dependent maleylpyruvate isomerase metal-binding domain-containing protein n=1 Tax=Virgisporangium aliadipatigenens TaxID=741659 RepID=A0A8J3YJ93_9ACTN|nr:DinB family protein [Virgisporangium aliadipatigenens]GIJ45407.1 hypothetical protein Val02_22930 [Virgisporangium aliadipatigenens]
MSAPLPVSLSERAGLVGGAGAVRAAFVGRRGRLLDLLDALPAADWAQPSRCAGWTVHDVVRHLVDVARLHVDQLGTGGTAFDAEAFHPARSPAQWMVASERATPAQTLDDLRELTEVEAKLLAERADESRAGLWRGPSRRPLHPTTFSLHLHWDAWLHERDITVPLGVRLPPDHLGTHLAVLYGLLLAATPARMAGVRLETSVLLDGGPAECYAISHGASGIVVSADTAPEAPLRSRADALLDALMGRGPALHTVLEGPAELVATLDLLRKFAT